MSAARQLNFLDARPLARTTDHDSSHEAADRAEQSGLVAGHEARILAALRSVVMLDGGWKLTAKQIAEATGLTNVQVCRRMETLVKRGSVERIAVSGKRLRWRAK